MSDEVEQVLDDCVRGGAFFVPPPGRLRIERARDTRQVFLHRPDVPDEKPVIDIRRDGQRLHVRRCVAMRGGGWAEEFIGTARRFDAATLQQCIEFCLVGTSRLPITSVETPLPLFTLGMIAYLPAGDGDDPLRDPVALVSRVADSAAPLERRARTLEVILRAASPAEIVSVSSRLRDSDLRPVLGVMFDLLALSPYTCLVDNLMSLLRQIERSAAVESIAYMLRRLARHLNAFDLVRFHNRGANYPDALMLDALLGALLHLSDEFDSPAERKALLYGWLARKRCSGMLVPDAPTSAGETARWMPESHPCPAPEHRTMRLFEDAAAAAEAMLTPAGRSALRRAADEVDVRELGTATFLDRPLGTLKRAGEADRTTLLSYEAFSFRLAQRRVREMMELGLITSAPLIPPVIGYAVAKMPGHARDGVVSLEDAKKVALDFVFTRTTRSSLDALLRRYDFSPLNAADRVVYRWLSTRRGVLLIRTGRAAMTAFCSWPSPVLTLDFHNGSYHECGGEEFLHGLVAHTAGGAVVPLAPLTG